MRRHGHTAAGTPRWYCAGCRASGIRTRTDTAVRHELKRFVRYLTGKGSVSEYAKKIGMARETLSRRFRTYFPVKPSWRMPSHIHALILDGSYIHGRERMVLIALTDTGAICWHFVPRETTDAWRELLAWLPRPQVVVCDGHNGLLSAINGLWPGIAIQRCHFHIAKLARHYLTMRPKTDAGREAKYIVACIPRIKTIDGEKEWRIAYGLWRERHMAFLAERTYYHAGNRMRWWYTHPNLRGVRSLLDGALPHLFTHLRHAEVPNTTNHVEGGLNAIIAEYIYLHRGLNMKQKEALVGVLLMERNRRRKTTRNVT
jgi:hypothetical protein